MRARSSPSLCPRPRPPHNGSMRSRKGSPACVNDDAPNRRRVTSGDESDPGQMWCSRDQGYGLPLEGKQYQGQGDSCGRPNQAGGWARERGEGSRQSGQEEGQRRARRWSARIGWMGAIGKTAGGASVQRNNIDREGGAEQRAVTSEHAAGETAKSRSDSSLDAAHGPDAGDRQRYLPRSQQQRGHGSGSWAGRRDADAACKEPFSHRRRTRGQACEGGNRRGAGVFAPCFERLLSWRRARTRKSKANRRKGTHVRSYSSGRITRLGQLGQRARGQRAEARAREKGSQRAVDSSDRQLTPACVLGTADSVVGARACGCGCGGRRRRRRRRHRGRTVLAVDSACAPA